MPTKKYESLSAEKTEILFIKVMPQFEGWTMNEIYDAADYIRAIACSICQLTIPLDPDDIKSQDLGFRTKLHIVQ